MPIRTAERPAAFTPAQAQASYSQGRKNTCMRTAISCSACALWQRTHQGCQSGELAAPEASATLPADVLDAGATST
jgi:hypothetical protein